MLYYYSLSVKKIPITTIEEFFNNIKKFYVYHIIDEGRSGSVYRIEYNDKMKHLYLTNLSCHYKSYIPECIKYNIDEKLLELIHD